MSTIVAPQKLALRARTMRGVVGGIIYQNDDGFIVASFEPHGQLLPVRIVGSMIGLVVGMELLISGRWTVHPQHGEQFRVENYALERPSTEEGLIRYLGSRLFPGIGRRTAKNIVARFGLDTLAVLDKDISRLLQVKNIGHKKLAKIKPAWAEQRKIAGLMLLLTELGVGPALAGRIHKEYGDEAGQVVRMTPFRLTEIRGVGFLTADRIARNLDLPHDAPTRIEAGVVHAQSEMIAGGHVCAPRQVLIKAATALLAVDVDLIEAAIERLAQAERLVLEPDIVVEEEGEPVEALYLPWLYHSEQGAARQLLALAAAPPALGIDVTNLPGRIGEVELSDRQREAVKLALTRKVVVITGGPGTGKTTIIHSILTLLKEAGVRLIRLAAPTGRAAKRMAEVCGHEASTIHRLLGASGFSRFEYGREKPLPVRVLIIDETSMVDIVLFNALLRALPAEAHLVIVGDADQLPSVGPGAVLYDLVQSGAIPVVRLDVIFRQAESSSIIFNAHRINRGQAPLLPQDVAGDRRQDFFFFSASDQQEAAGLVVDLVARRIPDKFGHAPEDIQVLSPLRRRGEAGANGLNRRLQAILNPCGPEQRVGERVLRVRDRIIQTRNDYTRRVFNGEIGVVAGIDSEKKQLTAFFDDRPVEYSFDDLHDVDLAYALSVHKSQGSEYPVVVLPVLTQHYVMLRRNLLYTAITRAKEMVIIVGQRQAIQMAVSEGRREKRFSGLRRRLAEFG
ncbi:ATP-dependent RecD-like DNA helicase [Chloroflexota bacterium]